MMDLKAGDVVQIDPEKNEMFGAAFMVVSEPKSWGAQGYFTIPGQKGQAYYRAKFDEMIFIGRAEWVTQDVHEEMEKEKQANGKKEDKGGKTTTDPGSS